MNKSKQKHENIRYDIFINNSTTYEASEGRTYYVAVLLQNMGLNNSIQRIRNNYGVLFTLQYGIRGISGVSTGQTHRVRLSGTCDSPTSSKLYHIANPTLPGGANTIIYVKGWAVFSPEFRLPVGDDNWLNTQMASAKNAATQELNHDGSNLKKLARQGGSIYKECEH